MMLEMESFLCCAGIDDVGVRHHMPVALLIGSNSESFGSKLSTTN